MNREKISLIGLAIVFLVGLTLFVRQEVIAPEKDEQPNREQRQQVEVKKDFGEKVVYQQDENVDISQYQQDCQSRGGVFNKCGDICAPGSEMCAQVCAYTCELTKPEENGDDADQSSESEEPVKINNFQDCVEAGNRVMESYPRQCRVDGETFTENVGNIVEMEDVINLSSPRPNQVISSPLGIVGQARGSWFFEASAPVVITDWDGKIIGEGYIEAQGDWMTDDFVNFLGTIEFESPEMYDYGSLILQKANPSDLPENDAALEIPVKFEN